MNKLSSILKSNVILNPTKEVILNLICSCNYIIDKNAVFFKKFKITAPQYNVLRILRGQKLNPINLSQIQERMVHKSSNAGRLVDKLVLKGLVVRSTCRENRRKIEIIITKKGLDLLELIEPELSNLENQNLSSLTDIEVLTLNSLLEKLRE
jgi:DNA-binding MarR family transcriptional regulator|tara:strand:- start:608 stop:1063 length:456 start_codon:yes stop_codon:yes gene_type:complete